MRSASTEPRGDADPSSRVHAYGTWQRRRWLWIGLGAAFPLLVVLGVLAGKAAVYQPITWGGQSNTFPGLPTGVGIKGVNNFGPPGGDYYVPPQRGVFSFGVTIYNSGSRPITIDSVALYPAPESVFDPIRLAGPVLYTTDTNVLNTPRVHVLHHVTIAAGETIFVGIPMRTWPCGQTDGWMSDPAFYVREHFLFFSHTVALPWSMFGARLIMHDAGGKPGDANTICAP